MTTDYTDWLTEDIGIAFSDFHGDFYGFYPKHVSMQNRDELIVALDDLQAVFSKTKETTEGRAQLRQDGWRVPEPTQEDGEMSILKPIPIMLAMRIALQQAGLA